MKHLQVPFGLSGLPGSGRPSKATHDSVHGHPVVFRPPLHSECPHRTMGVCLSAPPSCWHLLRRFLPIASESGHPRFGAGWEIGGQVWEDLVWARAFKTFLAKGAGRFPARVSGGWARTTGLLFAPPQPLPAAPHVALGPLEEGATSRN